MDKTITLKKLVDSLQILQKCYNLAKATEKLALDDEDAIFLRQETQSVEESIKMVEGKIVEILR